MNVVRPGKVAAHFERVFRRFAPSRCRRIRLAGAAAALFAGMLPACAQPESVDARVENLLSRMTLKEKLGQMNMPCVYERGLGSEIPAKQVACRRFAMGAWVEAIGPGGGFFTLADQILREGPRQQAIYFNELQKIAREQTRLGIPLLQSEEGTHGVQASGHTIFPEGPGIGSTWNMDLVARIYAAAAAEARSVGIHQLFTLVVEPNRDPRLGRNQEGYSEDPYLCARIAEAVVRGAQGDSVAAPDKVVAGLCHYPGQGQPTGGLERGEMEISERKLREIFLPPWVAGMRAGALGVMATYPAIDGVPVHASEKILTRILRDELGFRGLVLSEGSGIGFLMSEQHVADTQKKAGELAIKAGVDVGISYEEAYMQGLAENVGEGKVPMELIDRAVRRILRQKILLGLFERPYVDPERAVSVVHSKEHQDLALQAARESIVLLKNDKGLLPLKREIRSIAVIGPNADDARNQLGDYVSRAIPQNVVTTLAGIKAKLSVHGKANVLYARGCDITGDGREGFTEAREAAKKAEVAVVVVGERERLARGGTNGEGRDVASLDLSGPQEDLIRAVYETGTPTVVVLINGRPLSIRWTAEHVPAIVEAWLPGERGGDAVVDVLFGDYNPSGRLPITVPRHSGQVPITYDYKPTRSGRGSEMRGYVDMSGTPLYPFGHGLSYTTFEYRNLTIDRREATPEAGVRIAVKVTNSGQREGEETVQLYVRDLVSSVVRPVQQLRGFQKVRLKPGQEQAVKFRLTSEDLSFLDQNLKRVVEPGTFEVMIGASSRDIRARSRFEVK